MSVPGVSFTCASGHRLQIKYMTVLLELEVIQELRAGASKFAVALPGAQGHALHAKGTDRKREALLEKRRAQYEEQLGVPLDGWLAESAEHIAAMKIVREAETRRLQVRVCRCRELVRSCLLRVSLPSILPLLVVAS